MVKEYLDDFTESVKNLAINDEEEKEFEQILEKIKKDNSLTDDDKKKLDKVKDKARYVREISKNAIHFSNKLQQRTNQGFLIVLGMYTVAFIVGLVLIGFSLYFASHTSNPNEYLATFFGIAGIGDLAFLLYRPAKLIQESRARASRLLAGFMEWQFVSIWSGKTFGKLYGKFDECENKNDIFEKMITMLRLKVELTQKLISTMNEESEEKTEKKTEQTEYEKYLKLDKKNYSKATGTEEDKLDYSGWKVVKQYKEFSLGIDENKGKGPAEQFWTAKHVDEEVTKEPTEEEMNKKCEKTSEPNEPPHKCAEGNSWNFTKKWTQWTLLKHEKEEKWKTRCYHNIQWQCGKKPPQVEE